MIDAIALAANSVTTIEEFKEWTRRQVRLIFPHERLICGFGHIHAAGASLDGIVMIDYSLDYLQRIRNRAGGIDTPIMRRWMMTRDPVLFESDEPWQGVPPGWLRAFREHDMRNAAAHGVYDTESCIGTFYCFSRIPGRLGAAHAAMLKQLVPIAHEVLCRVIAPLNAGSSFATRLANLSSREQEILQWLKLGKANAAIASISGLSENTVKHHVTRIFRKLEVKTRSQLLYQAAAHEMRVTQGSGAKFF